MQQFSLAKIVFFGIILGCFTLSSCIEEEISIPAEALNPIEASIPEILTGKYEGLLVRIPEAQFNEAEGNTFEGTHILSDCDGNTIPVFTQASKVFSQELLPTGKGAIIAKVARDGLTIRLVLRSLSDVAGMVGLSCGQFANCTEKIGMYTNLCYLRNLFEDGTSTIPGSDVRIRVVLTSDIQGGNLDAKSMIVEDATAGIRLHLDNAHNYRPGDVLDIDITALPMNDPEGWLGIFNVPLAKVIKLGTNTLNPLVISINQLNAGVFESRLVKILNVNFEDADGSTMFGEDRAREFSIHSNTASIRINAGAAFRDRIIPSGSISLIGNAGSFSESPQLLPRTASDLGLSDNTNETQTCISGAILDVRNLYAGTPLRLTCNQGIRITGKVTSQADELNIPNQHVFLQDAGAGISVRFQSPHSFQLGDEISIDLDGALLTDFNDLIQLEDISLTKATLISSNNTLSPQSITVAQLNSGNFEGQLVKIVGVTFAQPGQALYNGVGSGTARSFSDATGSAVLFTYDDPLWASSTLLPAGSGHTLIGNASVFDGQIRILIRKPDDIQ